MDLPGVAAVDVDLELGEGDELNNSFFDMRGEGIHRDDQKVGVAGGGGGGVLRSSLIGTGIGMEGSAGSSSSSSSGGISVSSGKNI